MVTEGAAWRGENPFYLLIQKEDDAVTIDLDEPQWATTYADSLRSEATWYLIEKAPAVVRLAVICHQGDQGYYTARHIGKAGSSGSNEVIAYGLGKKQADGQMVRLWYLEGMTCGGDDVDTLGIRLLRIKGPKR